MSSKSNNIDVKLIKKSHLSERLAVSFTSVEAKQKADLKVKDLVLVSKKGEVNSEIRVAMVVSTTSDTKETNWEYFSDVSSWGAPDLMSLIVKQHITEIENEYKGDEIEDE
ncbi:hypothetical protein R4B61_07630 (plasmid) [Fructilactobacillus vespulae]|uniref:hypothetical protein n=1 Tax=Fructilactobacillus vespulae TaxID=1249630 RepID=UPI0039B4234C